MLGHTGVAFRNRGNNQRQYETAFVVSELLGVLLPALVEDINILSELFCGLSENLNPLLRNNRNYT
jgi:hypothetical protein